MTERVKELLNRYLSNQHLSARCDTLQFEINPSLDHSTAETKAIVFKEFLDHEQIVLPPNDRIGFYRYQAQTPKIGHKVENIIANYAYLLSNGFDRICDHLHASLQHADEEQKRFIDTALLSIQAIFDYCDRLKDVADGNLKSALERIPHQAPQTYHEVLVFIKMLIYTLRLNGCNHITLGRFDQYMLPYYSADVQRGVTNEEILELTEEFFISLNIDSDLYSGIQKGDNGQSIMLGGYDMDGNDCFNPLSKICMDASMELKLIDPKINLRVSKKTPIERLIYATEMTKLGLGFPQYNNDDIVIPGLIMHGYSPEEAHNYSVAACWEFIVPDSRDIPNIETMNFPRVINEVIHAHLQNVRSFDELMKYVKDGIEAECELLLEKADVFADKHQEEDAYSSLIFSTCIEQCRFWRPETLRHFNYGFHGAGIANAADALAAVKQKIFTDKTVTPATLLTALTANFAGYEKIQKELESCPKMGNNEELPDSIASEISECFAEKLSMLRTKHGGRIRPGTGSAMEYILSSKDVPATADGRYAGAPYSSSYSPAITTKLNGPLSVINSFTKFDLRKLINGGPLTMEIHDATFRNDLGIEKVAYLVKSFIEKGGHQLQLNAINRDRLLDAQKHPENHKNLIVRVWGWSGYFNELEIEYQNHIIKRTEFNVN